MQQLRAICATSHLKEFNKGTLKIAVEKKSCRIREKDATVVELLNIGNIKEIEERRNKKFSKK